ncbi:MAG: methylenetetrahydrofolate--tRNA-(uracil(54)-C(5))-methyltransferase (FADH(2)-oxidizing) TrmFO [Planctomycetota bacterium]|nr:MAG: methylenetetrahydrofolate--tRNA-(uracil(54)-C(5))-methyltransferase (FADH(2)-oxidizing) TrmFO [Planctomycetota bacterium]
MDAACQQTGKKSAADSPVITIIGAGLAGSEAAWSAAASAARVRLFEMRPEFQTPAHRSGDPAELVCSNSLGGQGKTQGKGLLQAEMRAGGSLILEAAAATAVPAGGALAVDRERFSAYVRERLEAHPRIELVRGEVQELPAGRPLILATGPLTSDALAHCLQERLGAEFLAFYDAAAPVVLGESIDMDVVYRAGRYGQCDDYLNCPLSEEDWAQLHQMLAEARSHAPHDWEKLEFFEGCMPIEELARRGYQTPLFGPLRPVGLPDPRSGRPPFAVVQLRAEDREERMWSLVGFQTGLKWGEQKAIVQRIPGLENAEVVRYGVMHRNTYLCAPRLIRAELELREHPGLFAAGVLVGVEGYLESAATGWLAGRNAARLALGEALELPPETSMLGALLRFLASAEPEGFQPMNANWGLVPPLKMRGRRRARREAMFERGIDAFRQYLGDAAARPEGEGG